MNERVKEKLLSFSHMVLRPVAELLRNFERRVRRILLLVELILAVFLIWLVVLVIKILVR